MTIQVFAVVLVCLVSCSFAAAEQPGKNGGCDVAAALSQTKVAGGLAVHLGTRDGAVEIELTKSGRFLVRGLALRTEAVEMARAAIGRDGRQYLASVGLWHDRRRLPLAQESVNLLVADLDALGREAPARDDLLSVLVPGDGGAAWVKQDGTWRALRQAMPREYDGWGQFWHDAQGTDCSRDTAVAPPTGIKFLHSYYSTSTNGLRLADGCSLVERIGSRKIPEDKYIETQDMVQRDAFNGLPLWVVRRPWSGATSSIWKHKPLVMHGGKIATILTASDGELPVFIDGASGETSGPIAGALPVANVVITEGHRRNYPDPDVGDVPIKPDKGFVKRFRRRDGKLIQELELASAPMRGGLAIARGRLYVASEDGTLTCFAP